jgi:hypothetical protein
MFDCERDLTNTHDLYSVAVIHLSGRFQLLITPKNTVPVLEALLLLNEKYYL